MNRITFLGIITVDGCNPNGDPLNINRPRQNYDGTGEISDVCLKHKIRNVLAREGESIIVQREDTPNYDGIRSIKERASVLDGIDDRAEFRRAACERWYDVRAFGQVFAFKPKSKGDGVSIGIRGPVSISPAYSVEPIVVEARQISAPPMDSAQKGVNVFDSDYIVYKSAYVFTGGISPQLAELTGFSGDDAERLHQAIIHMFDDSFSRCRPEGSLYLSRLYWWEHSTRYGSVHPVELHNSIDIQPSKQRPYFTARVTKQYDGVSLDEYALTL